MLCELLSPRHALHWEPKPSVCLQDHGAECEASGGALLESVFVRLLEIFVLHKDTVRVLGHAAPQVATQTGGDGEVQRGSAALGTMREPHIRWSAISSD